MTTSIPTPSTFLAAFDYSQLTKDLIWSSLSASQQQAEVATLNAASASSSTSSGSASGTTTVSGATTVTGPFQTINTIPGSSFTGISSDSQTPTAANLTALTALFNGSQLFDTATFVNIVQNRTAVNPFGDNASTNANVTNDTIAGGDPSHLALVQRPGESAADFAARTASYNSFENQVQQTYQAITSKFGFTQGLLGKDTNVNGHIDNETELFGFKSVSSGTVGADTLPNFSGGVNNGVEFLASNFALEYLLNPQNGQSVAINQSVNSLSFTNSVANGFYTAASTSLTLDSNGKVVLNVNVTT